MLSAADISQSFSPAALRLLADALLSAAKQGKTEAGVEDLLPLLKTIPEIKQILGKLGRSSL